MQELRSIVAGLLCLAAYFQLQIAKWLFADAWRDISKRLQWEHSRQLQLVIDDLREELGQQRLEWLEKVWIMHYNDCAMAGGQDCLQSARNGYIDGAEDLEPAPGWDWDYVQHG